MRKRNSEADFKTLCSLSPIWCSTLQNRVSEDPPFSHIGLHFAGPLHVNDQSTCRNRQRFPKHYYQSIRYLFTCASTRAVHRGLTAQDFLLAFRRFASRRGLPATIQSDNAKTFRSSSKEIRNITRSPEIASYLVNNQISWKFTVERAPWWGDYWERLVRSVKAPLHKVIGRTSFSYDELNSFLTEVEGVINARPLTYVYDDRESISYPLTMEKWVFNQFKRTSC